MKKLAFFDIDGTLFRSSLFVELVNELIERKIFPPTSNRGFLNEYNSWIHRQGSYEDYVNAMVQTFKKNIKGVHYGEVADVSRFIAEKRGLKVYRYTRDLIKTLRYEGYITVAVSQSPKTILDEFCAQYGFDKVYGRIYEIGPQDRFTGLVTDEHWIENKANIVKRVLESDPDFTLRDSIAVGDTEGDIPLLETVEQAICFNPNQNLYNHAKHMSWKVVVERKDVIYEL